MADYPINHHLYTYLWNKYRPALLKLMMDAAGGSQEYKFEQHEFRDVNPKEKGGYWFKMEVFKGKSQTDIRKSVVAQDLLIILQRSGKAQELMETTSFEFVMDKTFTLTITQLEKIEVVEEEETEETAPEEIKTEVAETKEEAEAEKEEETKEEVIAEKEEKGKATKAKKKKEVAEEK
ncbi:MAG: hypothetical protein RIM99_09175 [Cyclobacteriaceae bacterium]